MVIGAITYLGSEVVPHPRKGNSLQGESQGEYSSPMSTWLHCDSCAHLADSGCPEFLVWQWPRQTHNFLQQQKMCNRKKKKISILQLPSLKRSWITSVNMAKEEMIFGLFNVGGPARNLTIYWLHSTLSNKQCKFVSTTGRKATGYKAPLVFYSSSLSILATIVSHLHIPIKLIKTYWFFFSRNLEPFLSQIRSTVYFSALPAYLDHRSPLPPLPNRTALQQSKHLQHPRKLRLLYSPLKQQQNPQNKCVYKETNRRYKTTVSAWTNFNLVVCFCLLTSKQLPLFLGDCKNFSWGKTVHLVECSQDLVLTSQVTVHFVI